MLTYRPGLSETAQPSGCTRVKGIPTGWQNGRKACVSREEDSEALQHSTRHSVKRKSTHKLTWAPRRSHTLGWHLKKSLLPAAVWKGAHAK